MSINEELVLVEIDSNRICKVEFNQQASLNALSVDLLNEFKEVLIGIKSKDVLGLIITGAGDKSFVAGANIKEMLSMNSSEAQNFSLLGKRLLI